MKDLVVIDLDNTIVDGQSQQILLKYLFKNRHIGIVYYTKIYTWFILYKLGLVKDPKKVMEHAFKFLSEKKEEYIASIIDDFFEKSLKNRLFKEMLFLIEDHQKNNKDILIISNSINPIVKKVASFLDIDYIGTSLEVINDTYSGKIVGNIVYGKNKVDYLNKYIFNNYRKEGLNNIWSYADHVSDLDILKVANKVFVVNPNKSFKKKVAEYGWKILKFKNTNKI